MPQTSTSTRRLLRIAVAAASATTLLSVGLVGAPRASAEVLEHDVSVGAGGITFVVVGNYAVWNIDAFNGGTAPSSGPLTLTLDYNTGGQPVDPRFPHAYSDVHTIGALPGDCSIDTSAFRLTCVIPALAPHATAKVTLVARAMISDSGPGWAAKVTGDADDQNPANNTQYDSNLLLPKPMPDSRPVHADPGGVYAGYPLTSTNGQYTLLLGPDGDFVETGNGHTLWSSGTGGHPGAHFRLEDDGDGTFTTADGQVISTISASRTAIPYAELAVTNDGKVYAYDDNGTLWRNQPVGFDSMKASSRLESKQYLHSGPARLVMQSNGDLESVVGGRVVWRSHTDGHPGAIAKLRSDGNLAIYTAAGTALWSTHTRGTGTGNVLTLSTSGALTLKHGTKTVWRMS